MLPADGKRVSLLIVNPFAGSLHSGKRIYVKEKGRNVVLVKEENKWDYAVGMVKVDGLEPSAVMKELMEREKKGEITMGQVRGVLDQRYKTR